MLKKALKLAAQGFRVFPIAQNTKEPCQGISWPKMATSTDTQLIKKWWVKWPKANIGLVPAPDFFIFDMDMYKEKAKASAKKLISLKLPKTLSVKTPRGGYHFYYRHPGGGLINSKSKVWADQFPGIDIRADGAYVVAPGSIWAGKTYLKQTSTSIVNLPLSIIKLLPYKERWNTTQTLTDVSAESSVPPYKNLPATVKIGERDSFMFGYVCSLVSKGIPEEEISQKALVMFERCEQSSDQPFHWHTVQTMIDRAIKTYGVVPMETAAQISPEEFSPQLSQALKRYVLVEDGNLVVDLKAHARSAVLSLNHWQNAKMNVWIKKAKKPLPKIWLRHYQRLTAFGTTYYPNDQKLINRNNHLYYNTFIPSDVKPLEGDNSPALNHFKYLFDNDKHTIKYYLLWMAHTVKFPAVRIPWVPIIISPNFRIGKGWIFLLLSRILGEANCFSINPVDLSDSRIQFNEWLGGTLLCIDEIDPKYNFVERLKSMITEPYRLINYKYGKKEFRQIFCNFMAFSNHTNALKIETVDERWWVIRTDVQRQKNDYYTYIFDWLYTDGPAYFLKFLLNLDLSELSRSSTPPNTKAKERMIAESRSEIETCTYDAFELSLGPFKYDIVSTDIVSIFIRNRLDIHTFQWNEKKQLGYLLKRLCKAALVQDRYVIELGNVKKRHYLIMVRNPQKWVEASSEKIIEEFSKAYRETLL